MTNPNAGKATISDAVSGNRMLTLNERLALIGLIEEEVRQGSADRTIAADLFAKLGELVDATVSGSKIDRLKPEESTKGFQVFEINSEEGENLGRLNMLYMKKPIPCYYLVYVEVAPPFRNKGLGSRILRAFGEFLSAKNAVGILDNIIPPDEPTYDIYLKQEWKPVQHVADTGSLDPEGVYMVYVPPSMQGKNLGDSVRRLLHHLQRKRAAIDMRENELMVRRTIEEFKEVYAALLTYFGREIREYDHHALMRFMFTRFVTKLLGFRRRIGQLLGYTGGESMEQIGLDPAVASLAVKSYAPGYASAGPSFLDGDRELWLKLPEVLKKHPARIIESLPNYRRPSLVQWMETTGISSSDTLTIGDLMNLDFDPTRLKEITIDGTDYIFERVQARFISELLEQKEILEQLAGRLRGQRVKNSNVQVNPPLLVIRDRGNGYVLRKKVQGIHWEEAIEQLQSRPALRGFNASMKADKMIVSTVRAVKEKVRSLVRNDTTPAEERFAYFVAWNLENNLPVLGIDTVGAYVESIWVA